MAIRTQNQAKYVELVININYPNIQTSLCSFLQSRHVQQRDTELSRIFFPSVQGQSAEAPLIFAWPSQPSRRGGRFFVPDQGRSQQPEFIQDGATVRWQVFFSSSNK